jgi:hypothetical protein
MTEHHNTEIAGIQVDLAERAYGAWRRAESESERLLQCWFAAVGPDLDPAYLAYRAALDREQAAANALVPFRRQEGVGSPLTA